MEEGRLWCRHGLYRQRAHPGQLVAAAGRLAPHDSQRADLPEDRTEFDREYKRALATAAKTMELAGVHALLEQWRRRAWVTHDLQGYQLMMARIDRLRRGEDVPSVPAEDVRALIREQLGL